MKSGTQGRRGGDCGHGEWFFAGWLCPLLALAAGALAQGPQAGADVEQPALIPWPQSVQRQAGRLVLGPRSRIVCADPQVALVGELLAQEIARAYGLKLAVVTPGQAPAAQDGDLVLRLGGAQGDAAQGGDESYTLGIGASATLEAPTLDGLYPGSATLLQALELRDGQLSAPAMQVRDAPARHQRMMMVDLSGLWHEPWQIRKFIDLCRLYKVSSLMLRPSKSMAIGAVMDSTARLPRQQRLGEHLFTRQEMDELIAYARARGVRLVPYNAISTQSDATRQMLTRDWVPGDQFADWVDEIDGKGPYVPAKDLHQDTRFWNFLTEVLGRSTRQFAAGHRDGRVPLFHVGAILGEGGKQPSDGVAVLKILQQVSPGTRMMFWNGPSATDADLGPYKKDVVVCFYTRQYSLATVTNYLKHGWTVINAAWSPLYIVSAHVQREQSQVYNDWNLFRTGTDGNNGLGFDYSTVEWTEFAQPQWADQVLGGLFCVWEAKAAISYDETYPRLPAFAEHAWGHKPWPYPADDYPAFAARYQRSVQLLQRLTSGLKVHVEGAHEGARYRDQLTVTLIPAAPGSTVRYEKALRPPTPESPAYAQPIVFADDTVELTAQAFDRDNEPIGAPWKMFLHRYPIQATLTQGTGPGTPVAAIINSSLTFEGQLTMALETSLPGVIRYTTDNSSPTATSQAYTQALVVSETAVIKAGLFDDNGQRVGKLFEQPVVRRDAMPNLTLGKPVQVTNQGGVGKPGHAVDGIIDREKYWESHNGPQSITVDLEQETRISRVDVYTYWDGRRYYQYRVEISTDKQTWSPVADMSKNTTPATNLGYRHTFAPTPARYLRLTMLHNSANPGLHVVELRAFAPKEASK
ncbi:MAG: chitobiase/beta-hexosaminidase C-terminal domain-containing protein [Phycisphaeraceae bacterium]